MGAGQSEYTRGDIIYKYLNGIAGVTYWKHKGVYLGDNYVIHFTQDDNGTGVVKKDSLEAFANGKDVHFYSRSSSRTADKAESIYNGGGRDWKTYDLLTRNCGHFVTSAPNDEYSLIKQQ
ncbi:hypothetical protein LOD99_14716 [Oopsacas minuta]|uniref:LRAT domain-containing protein n=1 Tax=Oopsacas minuta TaxID=111878 RepID=A0AAV7KDR4_9METZ|nr:hypothetical protein LOD99_14716 [Oopsacas minuta]